MPTGPVARPWQRFLRFSVRGLFVLVLVIGSWLGWIVQSARTQREAVAAIKGAGGSVDYDRDWNDRKSIPGGLLWLVDFIGVDYFGHVTEVSFLSTATDTTIVQGAGVSHLGTLNGSSVADAGLAYLKGLTKLSDLNLFGTQVTDAGLAHLKGLTELSELNLLGTWVTDIGLAHLKRLTNLSSLNLTNTQVTDAGLAHLKGLTKLSSLNLNVTFVTDAGLVHLKGLTNLSKLELYGTLVTDAGAKELQHALPKLRIMR